MIFFQINRRKQGNEKSIEASKSIQEENSKIKKLNQSKRRQEKRKTNIETVRQLEIIKENGGVKPKSL